MAGFRLDRPEAVLDYIEAYIPFSERRRRAGWAIVCNHAGRVTNKAAVIGLPTDLPAPRCAALLGLFTRPVSGYKPPARLLFVLTRPGLVEVGHAERCWFIAARAMCRMHGVRLIGVYLLTPCGIRELAVDDLC